MNEHEVVTTSVAHFAAHAGEALAKTQVVGGIDLGRLAACPIPIAAILQIHHENNVQDLQEKNLQLSTMYWL